MASNTKKLIKHASIYGVGTIARQLASFIMLPIYTRYLTPADYGVIGLLHVAFIVIERLFGARLIDAVPKFYYTEQSKDDPGLSNTVVSTALIITTTVSFFSTVLLVVIRDEFSSVAFGTVEFGTIVGIYSTLLLTSALEQYALVYIRLQQRPVLFVNVNLCKLVVQLALNIWLVVFLELGVLGVAISAAGSSLLFGALLTAYTVNYTGLRFDRSIAEKVIKFTWPLWISGLAGIYIWTSNRYFIRAFGSLDDVGLFGLAAKFASVLMIMCWGPFFQYWQTERFNLYNKGDEGAAFRSVFYFISTILVIFSLGISIFSDPVIRIMAAPEFYDSISIVPFIVIGTLFAALVEFADFGILVKGKTGLITRNTYIIALLITALYFFIIPSFGYYGAAVALMLAQATQFFLTHWTAKLLYDAKISLKPLMLLLVLATLGYCVANHWLAQENIWFDLSLKLFVYIITSGGLILILMRDPDQRERIEGLITIVRNKISRTVDRAKS